METKNVATMLQKNNHKIVGNLVYALLEWILIFFLLLNSIFSYLIENFAKHFNLKPPCICCSRSINQILDPKHHKNTHICEAHALEISNLSYCFTHKKLAQSKNLCPNCSSPRPGIAISPFVTRVSDQNCIAEKFEEGKNSTNIHHIQCSCCEEILIGHKCPPRRLFEDSLDFLEYIKKRASLIESIDEEKREETSKFEEKSRYEKALLPSDVSSEALLLFDEDSSSSSSSSSDFLYGISELQKLKFSDSAYQSADNRDDEELCIVEKLFQNADSEERFICIELIDRVTIGDQTASLLTHSWEDSTEALLEKEASAIEEAKALYGEAVSRDIENGEADGSYEFSKIDENGSCSCPIDDCKIEDQEGKEKPVENTDSEEREGYTPESKCTTNSMRMEKSNLEPDSCDQAVETTTSDILHQFPQKRQLEMEESSNGIIAINDESLMSKEQLISMLKAQQKALIAELEEEKKTANEMIAKVQEEKASIQMEALQYQRMMEEQAEYDQEALQLLNNLMKKREKEKLELEKELEIYHEKVLVYESRKMTRSRSLSSSSRDSISSIDEIMEAENRNTTYNNSFDFLEDFQENEVEFRVPDISFEEFDEERLCILEELKALEEKVKLFDGENLFSDTRKRLLPLFDSEEEMSEKKNTPLVFNEEIGNIYERLQALEADKEFLKHCICSMMKGNKGVVLLQEILKHLQDLKAVELSYNRCKEMIKGKE